jgi:hypothetical protein
MAKKRRKSGLIKSTAVKVRRVSRNPVNVTLPGGRKVKAQSVVIGRTGAKVLVLDKDMPLKKRHRKANPKKRTAKKKTTKRTAKRRTTKRRTRR